MVEELFELSFTFIIIISIILPFAFFEIKVKVVFSEPS